MSVRPKQMEEDWDARAPVMLSFKGRKVLDIGSGHRPKFYLGNS